MSAISPPLRPSSARSLQPGQEYLRLSGLQWSDYLRFLDLLADRRLRITYDQGELEIMSVSAFHEWWKTIIARLLEELAVELGIALDGYGNFTCKREDLDRGLEPDECWYSISSQAVRGKRELDLSVDPPPDLALEVEISRSMLDRLSVYEALGVPEIWRHDGEELKVWLRQADGSYHLSETSCTFPTLPLDDFRRFLGQSQQLGQTEVVRQFRAWMREALVDRSGRKQS